MILDYRCPRCGQPVRGRTEVQTVSAPPKCPPSSCQNCGVSIILETTTTDLGAEAYFARKDKKTGAARSSF